MSIILIKQYREHDDRDEANKRLQSEFTDNNIATVVVPAGLDIEMVSELGNFGIGENLAVIKAYGDTKAIRDESVTLKADLAEVDVTAIILPADTSIEKIA